ncbi:isoleucine--tRNA ligase [Aliifodinibius sp. S!AR15-10]|uniref:isoleucine--tRNA ligase n=1 Tax=Aliifodinibius sp. S!AR15-10 TaxID=2950437 RepID=UPI00285D544B|nr:isoleucine--tRNA ligase [Aliifodinibius sp. S!AR15-10]MDR8390664.1 isoleucine--tRNA ligase [Aliifodinibius sp. S!AR15-10]
MAKQFEEVKQLNFSKLEVETLKWWKENDIFEKSLSTREEGIPFTFYEGPPTANGKPGIHHVMSRTVKDLFCRYKTLKGYKVERKAGWDTHGLPVEIEVEKELGLEGRAQVEEYGISKYNDNCRKSVLKYKDLWDRLTNRMAYWVDLDDPYVTFENDYIESIWWAFKTLFDKGLIYQGYKIQWYSPGSGTVLSSHEVSLGYEEVQDPSIFVKFKLRMSEDTYFLAWTTTPWTIISNMALAVNPKLDYAKIKLSEGDRTEYYVMAKDCIDENIDHDYEIVEEYKGKELIGWTYEPVFDFALEEYDKDDAWRVIEADYVTTEEGTGVVHTAPAFGADDYETCQEAGIPMFNPIDEDGKFTELAPDFEGQWFKDADKEIARAIKDKYLMYKHETYVHNYPFDWRKGTPLISYPVESWFIRTTDVKDKMVKYNKDINWKPPSTGSGRFGTWLENNVDWAISRQRYWGTPLPLWVSDKDPEYVECIGSVEELKKKAGLSDDEEIDLHRPHIDDLTWEGPDGGTMRRVPDLLDVWFDSGAMPFAQWHYPFENKQKFKTNFPADFIAEGVDQTRGWFYTLHALGTMLFDEPAYKNVVSNGLVLDEDGNKMSKSKGNTVEPFEVIQKYGADTVRWYMMSNSSPWENLKFSEEGLQETQRKFFNTLVNTYSFFAMYANIDGFVYSGSPIPSADRLEMDRWVISRLNSVVKKVDEYLDEYEPTKAAREIEDFVEELSNWYVRRNRRRFWKEGKSLDKTAAYQTLFECLLDVAKLISPFAPFLGEWLFQQLNEVTGEDEESVHISFYPTVEETAIDKSLEHRMKIARQISSMVLSLRNKIEINVRQPLQRIILPIDEQEDRQAVESVKGIILDEVNVKEVQFVDDDSGIVRKSAKPNFPVLGKKMGEKMKSITPKVQELSTEEITKFEETGSIELDLGEHGVVRLGSEDLEISRTGLEGWSVETENGLSVALDTELSTELMQEGLAREFVNRIQNMRKEADFDVVDRIMIGFEGSDTLEKAVESMDEYIKRETLAEKISTEELEVFDFVKTWEIGEEDCTISIRRNPN